MIKRKANMATLVEFSIYISLMAMFVLMVTYPRWKPRFLAIVTNPTIMLTAIGLYPLLLMVLIRRRKLRFGLDDLTAAFLGFGATLVPLDYLLQKFGFPLREYIVFVLYIEVMIGVGFMSALKNRNLLEDRVVALRWLIFAAFLMAPATVVPALIATFKLITKDELFHNDWTAMLAWLALVAPVLISLWFRTIFNVSKVDAEGAPRD